MNFTNIRDVNKSTNMTIFANFDNIHHDEGNKKITQKKTTALKTPTPTTKLSQKK